MAKFVVLYNGQPLKTYKLDEPAITVGRLPENTISIANMGVSRRHVRIEEDTDHKYLLSDLNSLNGTYVNGKRVKKVPLNSGDKISIGKYTIIYEEDSVDEEAITVGQAEIVSAAPADPATSEVFIAEQTISEQVSSTAAPMIAPHAQPVERPEDSGEASAVLIETNKHVVYKLDKIVLTLGNSETDDIFVDGFMIGKGQISIERQDDGVRISAQKLMGKFKVNGRPVKNHLLKHKDRIEIGSSTFRFMENG